MAAGEIRAGKAYVEVSTRDRVDAGLKQIEDRLKKFGTSVTDIGKRLVGFGTAIGAPLLLTAKAFASIGDEVAKASTRTGVGVEAISRLKYAADQSGSSLADLEIGLKKSAKLIFDAADASGDAAKTLNTLGLSFEQLAGAAPDEQFKTIADRIAAIEDPATRSALAVQAFGKSGTGLIPLIENGRKGIEDLERQADRLGVTIGTKDARAAEEFGDRLDDLQKVAKAAVFQIGAALAPALREVAVQITRGASNVVAWLNVNRQLVAQYGELALKVALAAVEVGGILIVIGKLIQLGGTAASSIRGMVGAFQLLAAGGPLAAIGALIAGLAVLYVGLKAASVGAADLRSAMSDQLTAAQQQRVAAKAALDTLTDLSKKQRLTFDEALIARDAIAALSKSYGNLGVTVNAVTGRLEGFAAASANVRKQETDSEIRRLNQAIVERKDNVRALKVELDQLTAGSNKNPLDKVAFVAAGGGNRLNKIADDIRREQAELGKLQAQKQNLTKLGGDVFADAGQQQQQKQQSAPQTKAAIESARRAAALAREADAQKELAQAQDRTKGEGKTADAKAIDDANDKLREQLNLIDELQNIARIKITLAVERKDARGEQAARADFIKLQQDRVAAARAAEQQIAELRTRDTGARADDVRATLENQLAAIEAKQHQAEDANDTSAVDRIEKERIATIEESERRIRELRKQSEAQQLADAQAASAAELQLINALADAAKSRGDEGEFRRLQEERVAAVQDAEQRIVEIRRASGAQQAADDVRRAEDERRRRLDATREQQDQKQLFLELQKALIEKRGKHPTGLSDDDRKRIADAKSRAAELDRQRAAAQQKGDAAGAQRFRRQRDEQLAEAKRIERRPAANPHGLSDEQRQQIDDAKRQAAEFERQRIAALRKGDVGGARKLERQRDEQSDKAKKIEQTPPDKFIDKQLRDLEFEQRLQSVFGDNAKLKDQARKLRDQIEATPDIRNSSAGTFNVAALQSLQSSPTDKEIAKNTAETAKQAKRIADKEGPSFT
jgi:hypothetical protein